MTFWTELNGQLNGRLNAEIPADGASLP